ncbi:uncharacterized protein [Diadema antillarum]|uniref:uncharacterized protein n=1 Tax=Diadema antillarum TaxID=105358 RepID=UPI003A8B9BCE
MGYSSRIIICQWIYIYLSVLFLSSLLQSTQACDVLSAPTDGSLSAPNGFGEGATVTFSCNSGFSRIGSPSATCEGGFWNRPVPSCIQDCSDPGTPENGLQVGSPSYEAYTTVMFQCIPGYSRVGAPSITCLGGFWTQPIPTCVQNCQDPGTPAQGFQVGSPSYERGTTVTFQCNAGYTLIGASVITCSGGSWDREIPTCEADCTDPGTPVNGAQSGSYENGATLSFTCNPGFTLVGAAVISCLNGIWSNDVPVCEADCGDPGEFADGTRTGGFGYGDTLTYDCNVGFTLVGAKEISCTSSGWDNAQPECYADCGDPGPFVDGTRSGTFGYGDTLVYVCNSGFTLLGASQLSCTQTGWDNDPPVCYADCGDPGVFENGVKTGGVGFGDTMTYTCNANFTLVGAREISCTAMGWDNDPPECYADCGDPGVFANGTKTGGVGYGDTMFYSCDEGFTLVGATEISCTGSGWDNDPPVCYGNCVDPGTPENGIQSGTFNHGDVLTFECKRNYELIGSSQITCEDGVYSGAVPVCQGADVTTPGAMTTAEDVRTTSGVVTTAADARTTSGVGTTAADVKTTSAVVTTAAEAATTSGPETTAAGMRTTSGVVTTAADVKTTSAIVTTAADTRTTSGAETTAADVRTTSGVVTTAADVKTTSAVVTTAADTRTTSWAETTAADVRTTSGGVTTAADVKTTSSVVTTAVDTRTTSGAETTAAEVRTTSGVVTTAADAATTSGPETTAADMRTTSGAATTAAGVKTTSGVVTTAADARTTSGVVTTAADAATTSAAETTAADMRTTSGAETTAADVKTTSGVVTTAADARTTSGVVTTAADAATTSGAETTAADMRTTSGVVTTAAEVKTTSGVVTTAADVGTTSDAVTTVAEGGTTSGVGTTSEAITLPTCPRLDSPEHGTLTYEEASLYNANATFSCMPGYILVGSSMIICVDGKWNGEVPECQVTCGPSPRPPFNGFIIPPDRYLPWNPPLWTPLSNTSHDFPGHTLPSEFTTANMDFLPDGQEDFDETPDFGDIPSRLGTFNFPNIDIPNPFGGNDEEDTTDSVTVTADAESGGFRFPIRWPFSGNEDDTTQSMPTVTFDVTSLPESTRESGNLPGFGGFNRRPIDVIQQLINISMSIDWPMTGTDSFPVTPVTRFIQNFVQTIFELIVSTEWENGNFSGMNWSAMNSSELPIPTYIRETLFMVMTTDWANYDWLSINNWRVILSAINDRIPEGFPLLQLGHDGRLALDWSSFNLSSLPLPVNVTQAVDTLFSNQVNATVMMDLLIPEPVRSFIDVILTSNLENINWNNVTSLMPRRIQEILSLVQTIDWLNVDWMDIALSLLPLPDNIRDMIYTLENMNEGDFNINEINMTSLLPSEWRDRLFQLMNMDWENITLENMTDFLVSARIRELLLMMNNTDWSRYNSTDVISYLPLPEEVKMSLLLLMYTDWQNVDWANMDMNINNFPISDDVRNQILTMLQTLDLQNLTMIHRLVNMSTLILPFPLETFVQDFMALDWNNFTWTEENVSNLPLPPAASRLLMVLMTTDWANMDWSGMDITSLQLPDEMKRFVSAFASMPLWQNMNFTGMVESLPIPVGNRQLLNALLSMDWQQMEWDPNVWMNSSYQGFLQHFFSVVLSHQQDFFELGRSNFSLTNLPDLVRSMMTDEAFNLALVFDFLNLPVSNETKNFITFLLTSESRNLDMSGLDLVGLPLPDWVRDFLVMMPEIDWDTFDWMNMTMDNLRVSDDVREIAMMLRNMTWENVDMFNVVNMSGVPIPRNIRELTSLLMNMNLSYAHMLEVPMYNQVISTIRLLMSIDWHNLDWSQVIDVSAIGIPEDMRSMIEMMMMIDLENVDWSRVIDLAGLPFSEQTKEFLTHLLTMNWENPDWSQMNWEELSMSAEMRDMLRVMMTMDWQNFDWSQMVDLSGLPVSDQMKLMLHWILNMDWRSMQWMDLATLLSHVKLLVKSMGSFLTSIGDRIRYSVHRGLIPILRWLDLPFFPRISPPCPMSVVGDRVFYRCRRGFELIGSAVLVCTPDGSWSNMVPQCRKIISTLPPRTLQTEETTADVEFTTLEFEETTVREVSTQVDLTTTDMSTKAEDLCLSSPCASDINTDCKTEGRSYVCQCRAGYTRDQNNTCASSQQFVASFRLTEIDGGAAVFSEELLNPASAEFQELSSNVESTLDTVYLMSSLASRYLGTTVNGFSNGSIITDYTVNFKEDSASNDSSSSPITAASVTTAFTESLVMSAELGIINVTIDESSVTVEDFDECLSLDDNNCDVNAICINTEGSFTCQCNGGYNDESPNLPDEPGRVCTRIQTTTEGGLDTTQPFEVETTETSTQPRKEETTEGQTSPYQTSQESDDISTTDETVTSETASTSSSSTMPPTTTEQTTDSPLRTTAAAPDETTTPEAQTEVQTTFGPICPDLTAPLHGSLRYEESYQHGDKVVFSCMPGYILVGPKWIICIDGEWSGPVPECQVTCGPSPRPPFNGFIIPPDRYLPWNPSLWTPLSNASHDFPGHTFPSEFTTASMDFLPDGQEDFDETPDFGDIPSRLGTFNFPNIDIPNPFGGNDDEEDTTESVTVTADAESGDFRFPIRWPFSGNEDDTTQSMPTVTFDVTSLPESTRESGNLPGFGGFNRRSIDVIQQLINISMSIDWPMTGTDSFPVTPVTRFIQNFVQTIFELIVSTDWENSDFSGLNWSAMNSSELPIPTSIRETLFMVMTTDWANYDWLSINNLRVILSAINDRIPEGFPLLQLGHDGRLALDWSSFNLSSLPLPANVTQAVDTLFSSQIGRNMDWSGMDITSLQLPDEMKRFVSAFASMPLWQEYELYRRGFELIGSAVLVCTPDGSWSNMVPQCRKIISTLPPRTLQTEETTADVEFTTLEFEETTVREVSTQVDLTTTDMSTKAEDSCLSSPCASDINTDCKTEGRSYVCQCRAGYTRDQNNTCASSQQFVASFRLTEIDGGAAVFSEELLNPASAEFQELSSNVESTLDTVYLMSSLASRYLGTTVNGFSNGSIITDYTVNFKEDSASNDSSSSPITAASVTTAFTESLVMSAELGIINVTIDESSVTVEGIQTTTEGGLDTTQPFEVETTETSTQPRKEETTEGQTSPYQTSQESDDISTTDETVTSETASTSSSSTMPPTTTEQTTDSPLRTTAAAPDETTTPEAQTEVQTTFGPICPDLTAPLHGSLRYEESYQHGDKVVFSCMPGYILVGPKWIICIDGEWSGPVPECQVTCGPSPRPPFNGFIIPPDRYLPWNPSLWTPLSNASHDFPGHTFPSEFTTASMDFLPDGQEDFDETDFGDIPSRLGTFNFPNIDIPNPFGGNDDEEDTTESVTVTADAESGGFRFPIRWPFSGNEDDTTQRDFNMNEINMTSLLPSEWRDRLFQLMNMDWENITLENMTDFLVSARIRELLLMMNNTDWSRYNSTQDLLMNLPISEDMRRTLTMLLETDWTQFNSTFDVISYLPLPEEVKTSLLLLIYTDWQNVDWANMDMNIDNFPLSDDVRNQILTMLQTLDLQNLTMIHRLVNMSTLILPFPLETFVQNFMALDWNNVTWTEENVSNLPLPPAASRLLMVLMTTDWANMDWSGMDITSLQLPDEMKRFVSAFASMPLWQNMNFTGMVESLPIPVGNRQLLNALLSMDWQQMEWDPNLWMNSSYQEFLQHFFSVVLSHQQDFFELGRSNFSLTNLPDLVRGMMTDEAFNLALVFDFLNLPVSNETKNFITFLLTSENRNLDMSGLDLVGLPLPDWVRDFLVMMPEIDWETFDWMNMTMDNLRVSDDVREIAMMLRNMTWENVDMFNVVNMSGVPIPRNIRELTSLLMNMNLSYAHMLEVPMYNQVINTIRLLISIDWHNFDWSQVIDVSAIGIPEDMRSMIEMMMMIDLENVDWSRVIDLSGLPFSEQTKEFLTHLLTMNWENPDWSKMNWEDLSMSAEMRDMLRVMMTMGWQNFDWSQMVDLSGLPVSDQMKLMLHWILNMDWRSMQWMDFDVTDMPIPRPMKNFLQMVFISEHSRPTLLSHVKLLVESMGSFLTSIGERIRYSVHRGLIPILRWLDLPFFPRIPSPRPMSVVGDRVFYRCRRGFELIGPAVLVCTPDGSWSNMVPQCRKIISTLPPRTLQTEETTADVEFTTLEFEETTVREVSTQVDLTTTEMSTKAEDPCLSNPCASDINTDCKTEGRSYVCQCRAGYTRDQNNTCASSQQFVASFRLTEIDGGAAVFSEELLNPASAEFQELSSNVESTLDTVYLMSSLASRYLGTTVNGFSNGSIITDYTVNFKEDSASNDSSSSPITAASVTTAFTESLVMSAELGIINVTIDESSVTVEDFDECLSLDDNNCDVNAICINTEGSFTCQCNGGYNDESPNLPDEPGRVCTRIQTTTEGGLDTTQPFEVETTETSTQPSKEETTEGQTSPYQTSQESDDISTTDETVTSETASTSSSSTMPPTTTEQTTDSPLRTTAAAPDETTTPEAQTEVQTTFGPICPDLTAPLHGSLRYEESYQHGDKVVFSCMPGYILVGPKWIICIDGEWSGPVPECQVTCGPSPRPPFNGFIIPPDRYLPWNPSLWTPLSNASHDFPGHTFPSEFTTASMDFLPDGQEDFDETPDFGDIPSRLGTFNFPNIDIPNPFGGNDDEEDTTESVTVTADAESGGFRFPIRWPFSGNEDDTTQSMPTVTFDVTSLPESTRESGNLPGFGGFNRRPIDVIQQLINISMSIDWPMTGTDSFPVTPVTRFIQNFVQTIFELIASTDWENGDFSVNATVMTDLLIPEPLRSFIDVILTSNLENIYWNNVTSLMPRRMQEMLSLNLTMIHRLVNMSTLILPFPLETFVQDFMAIDWNNFTWTEENVMNLPLPPAASRLLMVLMTTDWANMDFSAMDITSLQLPDEMKRFVSAFASMPLWQNMNFTDMAESLPIPVGNRQLLNALLSMDWQQMEWDPNVWMNSSYQGFLQHLFSAVLSHQQDFFELGRSNFSLTNLSDLVQSMMTDEAFNLALVFDFLNLPVSNETKNFITFLLTSESRNLDMSGLDLVGLPLPDWVRDFLVMMPEIDWDTFDWMNMTMDNLRVSDDVREIAMMLRNMTWENVDMFNVVNMSGVPIPRNIRELTSLLMNMNLSYAHMLEVPMYNQVINTIRLLISIDWHNFDWSQVVDVSAIGIPEDMRAMIEMMMIDLENVDLSRVIDLSGLPFSEQTKEFLTHLLTMNWENPDWSKMNWEDLSMSAEMRDMLRVMMTMDWQNFDWSQMVDLSGLPVSDQMKLIRFLTLLMSVDWENMDWSAVDLESLNLSNELQNFLFIMTNMQWQNVDWSQMIDLSGLPLSNQSRIFLTTLLQIGWESPDWRSMNLSQLSMPDGMQDIVMMVMTMDWQNFDWSQVIDISSLPISDQMKVMLHWILGIDWNNFSWNSMLDFSNVPMLNQLSPISVIKQLKVLAYAAESFSTMIVRNVLEEVYKRIAPLFYWLDLPFLRNIPYFKSPSLVGDKVVYSCIRGFQLIGYPALVCKPDGSWSGMAPICKKIIPTLRPTAPAEETTEFERTTLDYTTLEYEETATPFDFTTDDQDLGETSTSTTDPCMSSPCTDDANTVCQRNKNSFKCVCRAGYARDKSNICTEVRAFAGSLSFTGFDGQTAVFSDDLLDQNSPQFKELSSTVESTLDVVYQTSSVADFYLGTVVTAFSNGSIITAYRVNFKDTFSANAATVADAFRTSLATAPINATIDESSITVEDFDECLSTDDNDCDVNAACINTEGSFTCQCESGFIDSSPDLPSNPGRQCDERGSTSVPFDISTSGMTTKADVDTTSGVMATTPDRAVTSVVYDTTTTSISTTKLTTQPVVMTTEDTLTTTNKPTTSHVPTTIPQSTAVAEETTVNVVATTDDATTTKTATTDRVQTTKADHATTESEKTTTIPATTTEEKPTTSLSTTAGSNVIATTDNAATTKSVTTERVQTTKADLASTESEKTTTIPATTMEEKPTTSLLTTAGSNVVATTDNAATTKTATTEGGPTTKADRATTESDKTTTISVTTKEEKASTTLSTTDNAATTETATTEEATTTRADRTTTESAKTTTISVTTTEKKPTTSLSTTGTVSTTNQFTTTDEKTTTKATTTTASQSTTNPATTKDDSTTAGVTTRARHHVTTDDAIASTTGVQSTTTDSTTRAVTTPGDPCAGSPCASDINTDCVVIEMSFQCTCRAGYMRNEENICTKTQVFISAIRFTEFGGSKAVYSDELSDPNSEEFQNLASDVESTLDTVYQTSDLADVFLGTSVSGFSNGSIVVDYTVIFADPASMNDTGNSTTTLNTASITTAFTTSLATAPVNVTYDESSIVVLDANECASPEDNNCALNATCINLEGSFTCQCDNGFNDESPNLPGEPGRVCTLPMTTTTDTATPSNNITSTTSSPNPTNATTPETQTNATTMGTTPMQTAGNNTNAPTSQTPTDGNAVTNSSTISPTTMVVDPCSPDPCTGDAYTTCEASGQSFQCVCRPGFSRGQDGICAMAQSFLGSLRVTGVGDGAAVFTEDLQDPNSDAFQSLASDMTNTLDTVYSSSSLAGSYLGSTINGFSNGSIIVDYTANFASNSSSGGLNAAEVTTAFTNSLATAPVNLTIDPSSIVVTDLDECLSPEDNNCALNATCINLEGSFTCQCKSGFDDVSPNLPDEPGRACNVSTSVSTPMSTTSLTTPTIPDPCASNPCERFRHTKCLSLGRAYICYCRPGYARNRWGVCSRIRLFFGRCRFTRLRNAKAVFTSALADSTTAEFAEVAAEIKGTLATIYTLSTIASKYVDVVITSFSNGSIVVDYELEVDFENSTEVMSNSTVVYTAFTESLETSVQQGVITDVTIDEDSIVIEDFDECSSADYHDCATNAQCINTEGSFTCRCNDELIDISPLLPGRECRDPGPCPIDLPNTCAPSALCMEHYLEGYTCECRDGYFDASPFPSLPGRICEEICPDGYCSNGGTCFPAGNGSSCTCLPGYSGERCERSPDELHSLEILGIALGAVVFVILVIILIVFCCAISRQPSRFKQPRLRKYDGEIVEGRYRREASRPRFLHSRDDWDHIPDPSEGSLSNVDYDVNDGMTLDDEYERSRHIAGAIGRFPEFESSMYRVDEQPIYYARTQPKLVDMGATEFRRPYVATGDEEVYVPSSSSRGGSRFSSTYRSVERNPAVGPPPVDRSTKPTGLYEPPRQDMQRQSRAQRSISVNLIPITESTFR